MENLANRSFLESSTPWPDLGGFFEGDYRFFKGRDREIGELTALIRAERVCVIYGKSGMGKTSLLRAGVFPALRQSRFVPVYIRLKYDVREAPLAVQVQEHLKVTIQENGIDAPLPIRGQSLWEYFHRKDVTFWSKDHKIATPVLVFDQFEEVLTTGQTTDASQARSLAFLDELEDLVEHRVPERLRAELDSNPALAEGYEFTRSDFRVVLCLREDFLPELESFRSRLRGVMTNRFRLMPMNGEQAFQVVSEPVPGLVDTQTTIEIIDRISRGTTHANSTGVLTRADIAKRCIEPALLCLLCRELNRERLKRSQNTITLDLVRQSHEAVIHDFYERAMTAVSGKARTFVEEKLITESGLRGRYAKEDAIVRDGVSEAEINILVDEHLLRREISDEEIWLELTHDRLADVALSSRNNRRERDEAARKISDAKGREAQAVQALATARKKALRRLLAAIISAVVVILAVLVFAEMRIAEAARRETEAAKRETAVTKREAASSKEDSDSKRHLAEAAAELDRRKAEEALKEIEVTRREAAAGQKDSDSKRQLAEAAAELEKRKTEEALKEIEVAKREVESTKKDAEQQALQESLIQQQTTQQMELVKRQAEDSRRIIDSFVRRLSADNSSGQNSNANTEAQTPNANQSVSLSVISDAVLDSVKDSAGNAVDLTRQNGLLLASAGLLYFQTSNQIRARELLERAQATLGKLATKDPNDEEVSAKQFDVLIGLGDLERAKLKPGAKVDSGSAARDFYGKALDIARHWASLMDLKNSAYWQLRTATSMDRLGDVERVTGDSQHSRDTYSQAIKALTEIGANNNDFLKQDVEIAIVQSLNKIGNSYRNSDLRLSLDQYEKAAKALQDLFTRVKELRTRPDLLWLQAIIQHNIGTVYRDLKDYSEMQKRFRSALEIYQTLYAEHPDNVRWSYWLAYESNTVAYYYLFDVPPTLRKRDLALYHAFRAVSLNGEKDRTYLSTLRSALISVGTVEARALAAQISAKIQGGKQDIAAP